ncbi:rhodanese-like domain-containing protein [Pacificibacter sp. AS14]|uniref:rhodanese-like domain-containing protein n=1 Tax=Pacificibacter sp. AS14 TaxID=3135785 RepID=UPI00316F6AF6
MFGLFKSGPKSGPKISVDDIRVGISSGTTILIDVRDPSEVAQSGIAKGAVNIPLAALAMRANPSSPECDSDLKLGKKIVLYCASGARSAGAARMLTQMGHRDVQNLGSLTDWTLDGGDIHRA